MSLEVDVRIAGEHTYDVYLVGKNHRRVLIGKSKTHPEALRLERELRELLNGK